MSETRIETRARYPHYLIIPTRWMDNDIFGHVNNVVYYSYFDTVINGYLIDPGGFDIHGGPVVGVCAESTCRYHAAFVFPEPVEAGLRVGHLGRTSARYEIGLFKEGEGAGLQAGVRMRSSAARMVSGIGTGVMLFRSTKTWTKWPSAAASSSPALNRPIS